MRNFLFVLVVFMVGCSDSNNESAIEASPELVPPAPFDHGEGFGVLLAATADAEIMGHIREYCSDPDSYRYEEIVGIDYDVCVDKQRNAMAYLSQTIVALPAASRDITQNCVAGRGGNIREALFCATSYVNVMLGPGLLPPTTAAYVDHAASEYEYSYSVQINDFGCQQFLGEVLSETDAPLEFTEEDTDRAIGEFGIDLNEEGGIERYVLDSCIAENESAYEEYQRIRDLNMDMRPLIYMDAQLDVIVLPIYMELEIESPTWLYTEMPQAELHRRLPATD